MLALDALIKQLHDGIKDMMAVQESVHTRLIAKTNNKAHEGPQNGWPATKKEEAKID